MLEWTTAATYFCWRNRIALPFSTAFTTCNAQCLAIHSPNTTSRQASPLATPRFYEATDWRTILSYYDELAARFPSPVIALNRVVAIAMLKGPQAGIDALDQIARLSSLKTYYLLPATYGEFYRRTGNLSTAAEFFRTALSLTANQAERRFIARKLSMCSRASAR
jgi:RNA polymerase sigma-70 factor (ECF subfamily)